VKVEFDPQKDLLNQAKHGLSLARAADMDLLRAKVLPDSRGDYGEPRYRAYGIIEARMHMLAFTLRDGVVRAISLRKANAKEVRRYG
jgi:uncharacterized DUF497 family protein